MKNTYRTLFKYGLLFISLLFLSNCTIVKGIRSIKQKKVKTEYLSYHDKSIVLIPIHHFGQQQFYANLKDTILDLKKRGYTIFYEEINPKPETKKDTTVYNLLQMKMRKMIGLSATRESYGELKKVFKNGISQPKYHDLGIDGTDVNADVKLSDLINQYELLYGKIILNDCDYTTPLDTDYDCESLKNNLTPIIITYRNKQLVKRLKKSEKNKIAIIYGKNHIKGVKKLLKN